MKTTKTLITTCLVCGFLMLGGCQQKQTTQPNAIDQDQANRKLVDAYSDMAIQNAIITQHTLYPYHFVNNSADLNGVGRRDLAVLIQHFQQNPGQINLQRGSVEEPLYLARKQTVYKSLVDGGIPQDKIQIAEGMPGGDGMPSNSVIEILENAKESPDSGQESGKPVQYNSTMGKR